MHDSQLNSQSNRQRERWHNGQYRRRQSRSKSAAYDSKGNYLARTIRRVSSSLIIALTRAAEVLDVCSAKVARGGEAQGYTSDCVGLVSLASFSRSFCIATTRAAAKTDKTMCLYEKTVPNKHYLPNKKNGGFVPECPDIRLRVVKAKCGKCIECRKAEARDWMIRLNEEMKHTSYARFMTMTFSEESFIELNHDENEPNITAAKAVRLFTKRWRKQYKESVRHWLVTELGHDNTERLHIHGFLWTDKSCAEIEKVWKYGWVDTGEYVNENSVAYVVKYIEKVDAEHPDFKGRVLTSPGIGKGWLKTKQAGNRKYSGPDTKRFIRNSGGFKMAMPNYYARRLYSDEERELMNIRQADENIRYVCGEKIDISTIAGKRLYIETQNYYRKMSKKLGYK